ISRALPHCPAERIIVAPDCGMKYLPREVAYGKMVSMVKGAALVREALGAARSAVQKSKDRAAAISVSTAAKKPAKAAPKAAAKKAAPKAAAKKAAPEA